MNAEPEFLASAYLDGDLTADERRRAETDPTVMAEVEQLRALRDELATPPPPSDASREAAIAAAMAEFGRARPHAPVVVPYRPRPAWAGWMSVAAAALVIGVLGIAVVAGVRGGDDDDTAASEPAAEEPAAEEPAELLAEARDADDDAADAAEEPAMEMAEEATADVMDAAGGEPAEEPAAAEPASEPASAPMVEVGDPLEYLEDGRAITSPDELAVVGRYLADQVEDGTIGATPESACPYPEMLDTADVDTTGQRRLALINLSRDDNTVLAIDDATCEILLRSELPQAP